MAGKSSSASRGPSGWGRRPGKDAAAGESAKTTPTGQSDRPAVRPAVKAPARQPARQPVTQPARPAAGPASRAASQAAPVPEPAAPAGRSRLASALRLAWLPILVGLVAGAVVAVTTGASVGQTTEGVVNTRTASTQPNERVDLINDLATLPQISAVIDPVADAAGLSSPALRDALRITRIESSTLVRLSLSTAEGDDAYRRGVLEDFLDAARGYLQPPTPSPAVAQGQDDEAAAIEAYYAAIEEAGGLRPDDVLSRLDAQLVDARRANDRGRVRQLEKQLPQAISDATEFAKLGAARDRASANLDALASAEAETASSGPAGLELTYLDDASGRDGITSGVALRRGGAAGVVTALLVAGLILLLARRRRLPTATP